jgi:hypothetical protein
MFKFILPKFILRVERWKWNKEYRIYVSNMGHFRDEHKRPIPVKINSSGYVVVPIGYDHGYPSAHRIVMKTWRPTMGMEELSVDHLDHNKRNNALYNLEWVTVAENQRRAAEDYIPAEPKKKKENNRVYKDSYSFSDFDFYVRGKYYPTVEEAYAAGCEIICGKESKGRLNDFTFEGLTGHYNKFVNICNNGNNATKKQILSGMYANKKYCGLKINVKEKKV